ncbi:MAG: hypothetical protein AB1481_00215, partial [Candidatus Omnitrophota bacterium]
KEYAEIEDKITQKTSLYEQRGAELKTIEANIKHSLEFISKAKKEVLEWITKITGAKNELADLSAKGQIHLARQKRLEVERLKVSGEEKEAEADLTNITNETSQLHSLIENRQQEISTHEKEIENSKKDLADMESRIVCLEKEISGLESHREFLDKLKSKYDNLGESLNAEIILDKLPSQKIEGLVVKVKDCSGLKLSGEAKPIELDTKNIQERIARLSADLTAAGEGKKAKELHIAEFDRALLLLKDQLHTQEIALANKESVRQGILEQFGKIKEEHEVIEMELNDIHKELLQVQGQNISCQARLDELNNRHKEAQDCILKEETGISVNNRRKEEALVSLAQIKTEISGLNNKLSSDQVTLKIVEETYLRDKAGLDEAAKQFEEALNKQNALKNEIEEFQVKIEEYSGEIENEHNALRELEENYNEVSLGMSEVVAKIEADRKELDVMKTHLYELQMQNKDIDYKYSGMKERLSQSYKIDLDTIGEPLESLDAGIINTEIEQLKQKLDSYGTVNLVAIEEYDELKERYDFLVQQQGDLNSAKESLHQAILKINRTTKQMFMETFEKVREEFRNYFRMLFNGGDAQVFLIDEEDPLESGIEIICRPPGKKLQNVLLLSGGEKSLSAIALIFAIFKVKPSPFCILDEIDAALDEANVDRFSRMLHEFAQVSQFIVITHNKKTIANADVMYGITMQQSGVSRIVSVKFAKEQEPQKEVAQAA